jgi:SAM-dependent methyltransferase
MVQATSRRYVGTELDLFALAANWKRYVKKTIAEYLAGHVLEVGAGIGGTTAALHNTRVRRWVCLEPDFAQANRLRSMSCSRWGASAPNVITGDINALKAYPNFDCILYMDVLEHIPDDHLQIEQAARLVRKGGHLVILSPAHARLFSEFDKSVGHLRRYNKRQLRSLMPRGWTEEKLVYLDFVGTILSFANVFALRQPVPSRLQITIWDRLCVPVSRIVDRLLLGRVGKSILAVWQKPV